jgi:hypothetical protein
MPDHKLPEGVELYTPAAKADPNDPGYIGIPAEDGEFTRLSDLPAILSQERQRIQEAAKAFFVQEIETAERVGSRAEVERTRSLARGLLDALALDTPDPSGEGRTEQPPRLEPPRLASALHELASTIGRARVLARRCSSPDLEKELADAADAMGRLRNVLSSDPSGEQGEEVEYRVNDAEGIGGPYDRTTAEYVHAGLMMTRGDAREPVIESRRVRPWSATDTSKEEREHGD